MKLTKITVLVCLLALSKGASALERVIIFSQTYCPSCAVTKAYLEKKSVPYSEFFIDKSQAALDYFVKLGGQGTPFIIVDNQRMQGFQVERFWQIYEQSARN